MKKNLIGIIIVGLLGFGLLQLIPVERSNPSVTREIRWNSEATQNLARRACYDCHSNETVWPWYASIAPVKFILADHVSEGREKLNFSQWDQPQREPDESIEEIEEGKMPLWDYLIIHSEARLSASEKEQLIAGVKATLSQDPPIEREKGDD